RTIIEESNGDLYVGSSYGLHYYDAATASWKWYRYTKPETRKGVVSITDMLNDSDYIYIVGYGENVFYRFDKHNKKFDVSFYGGGKKLSAYSLFRGRDSLIWIGTKSG